MTMIKKYIEDKDGSQVLPITHFSAVKDSDGNTLEDVLWEEKEYDPTHYSGMGRITLKKNMVGGVNTLTRSMMQATNTIYVIRYDFTLGGDIKIPANCVLEFDGGSISGNETGKDTITGTNTGINAGLVKIFNTDVTLAGTWNVVEAYPEWFGAKGDGVTDDVVAIQKCVDFGFGISSQIRLSAKQYSISKPIILYGDGEDGKKGSELVGSGIDKTTIVKTTNNTTDFGTVDVDCIIAILNPRNESDVTAYIKIANITICSTNHINGVFTPNIDYGIFFIGNFYSTFDNIKIYNAKNGVNATQYNFGNIFKCVDVQSPEIGFNFGTVPFGTARQTTLTFEKCHVGSPSNSSFYINAGATLIGCAQDGGPGKFINAPLIADQIYSGRLVVISPHIESINSPNYITCGGGQIKVIGGVFFIPSIAATLFTANKMGIIEIENVQLFKHTQSDPSLCTLYSTTDIAVVNIKNCKLNSTLFIQPCSTKNDSVILYDGNIDSVVSTITTRPADTIARLSHSIKMESEPNAFDHLFYIGFGKMDLNRFSAFKVVLEGTLNSVASASVIVSDTVDSSGIPENGTTIDIGIDTGNNSYNVIGATSINYSEFTKETLLGCKLNNLGNKYLFLLFYTNTGNSIELHKAELL